MKEQEQTLQLMKISTRHHAPGGFTLMEMLIVMGIIIVLAGGVTFVMVERLNDAKLIKARQDIDNGLRSELDAYKLVGRKGYPTTSQGLEALRTRPTTGPIPRDHTPKFKAGIPKDPWGNDYIYTSDNGKAFSIVSKGPDGQLDTVDDIKSTN